MTAAQTPACPRRRPWSEHELRLLHERYPHEPTAAVAAALGRPVLQVYQAAMRYRVKKTAAYLASPYACRLRSGDGVGRGHRFRAGHTPWNKGLRGYQPGGRSAATRFKPGNVSKRWDAEIYRVLGALRLSTDGVLWIRTALTGSRHDWEQMARWEYARAHGPIPPGAVVSFRDGDAHNCLPENLYLRTKIDVMRANSIHTWPRPLRRAVQLRGALMRQIRLKERETAHG